MGNMTLRHRSSASVVDDTAYWSEIPRSGDLRHRVHGEFCEMPGLSVTVTQAARLFGLSETNCETVLHELVEVGLLHRRADGRYALKTPRG